MPSKLVLKIQSEFSQNCMFLYYLLIFLSEFHYWREICLNQWNQFLIYFERLELKGWNYENSFCKCFQSSLADYELRWVPQVCLLRWTGWGRCLCWSVCHLINVSHVHAKSTVYSPAFWVLMYASVNIYMPVSAFNNTF